jgi:hypothetical protein
MSGLLAAFPDAESLRAALAQLRAARLGTIETYTPQPLEEGPSLIPLAIFVAGVFGTVASFALQSYANVSAYPLDIGGRPPFSWPSFIPIAFENGILAAVATGFFGFFVANRLPRLYEPIDECLTMRRAMRDRWCVAIRTEQGNTARLILESCAADTIEVIPE